MKKKIKNFKGVQSFMNQKLNVYYFLTHFQKENNEIPQMPKFFELYKRQSLLKTFIYVYSHPSTGVVR